MQGFLKLEKKSKVLYILFFSCVQERTMKVKAVFNGCDSCISHIIVNEISLYTNIKDGVLIKTLR